MGIFGPYAGYRRIPSGEKLMYERALASRKMLGTSAVEVHLQRVEEGQSRQVGETVANCILDTFMPRAQ